MNCLFPYVKLALFFAAERRGWRSEEGGVNGEGGTEVRVEGRNRVERR